jgi:predicted NBD/HSP70 family sugar kinase
MRPLSLNERKLVEMIATRGPIARTDLSAALGLTGATVTRMVGELDHLGLFDERPDRQGRGGQPKRLLELRKRRFYSAGLTFSRQSLELAILDLAGQIVDRQSLRPRARSALAIAAAASDALESLMQRHQIAQEAMIGVGCAMPGNFGDGGQSIKAHGVFADFDNPDVVDAFKSAFTHPVWIENDGKSAAIAEHVYGRLPEDGPALYFLHIGHGLGGGAVVDGAPFRGVNGNACLPGFLFPYDAPRPSGLDLLNTLAGAGYSLQDFSDLDQLLDDCPELHSWTSRAGEQLAQVVLAATAFIDPSTIVLGGRLPRLLNQRLVEQIRSVSGQGPSRGLKAAPIRAATLGPEGGAIGAACLPLFETFFGGHTMTFGSAYLDGRRTAVSTQRPNPFRTKG